VTKRAHPGGTSPATEELPGTAVMQKLVLEHDWAATPLGPMADWPRNLRQAVTICLASQFPMIVRWGRELIQIYNDGYRAIMGDKHPGGLGQPTHECWPEAREFTTPIYDRVLSRGDVVYLEDQKYSIVRRGFLEEAYFTVAYGPIFGRGGIDGVFVSAVEMTARHLLERRLRTLQQLAACAARARSVAAAAREVVEVLADNHTDVPFALLYLLDRGAGRARLAGLSGLEPGGAGCPETVDLTATAGKAGPWPLAKAAASRQAQVVRDLPQGAGQAGERPVGPIFVIPLNGQGGTSAVVVVATSARLALDKPYRTFVDSVATNVGLALTSAHTYETEHRRADALAAATEAKTAFLHSVSHEFRTPLTLLLGPLADMLSAPETATLGAHREELRTAHRAGLRLSRLVDALLLAAQTEAGRLHPRPQATDLARYTAGLASMFCSAIEHAGLRLTVSCPPLPAPVLVDWTMWEHIVFNLLSNAVKFTLAGEIRVGLRAEGGYIRLTVRDTGIGIPPDVLPKIFDRFHRVSDDRARSAEGAGIGLSLVAEMVGMVNGTVDVTSEPGAGTTFTVVIPYLTAEGDRATAATTEEIAARAAPFIAEAAGWSTAQRSPAGEVGQILVVEDNADLREYLIHLLSEQGWTVTAAPDGHAALTRIRRHRPELVLTGVMIPRLDGFSLLRALRADPDTARLPVLMLTARADTASATEGLQAGADDYIVKPFKRSELIARVRVNLELSRAREDQLGNLTAAMYTRDLIGQAMGILMERRQISSEEAVNLLRRWSQRHNVKIAKIAETLITRGRE
jgi:signal transduction histidine kinase/DNA-binding response OmpR family regulator